MDRPQNKHLIPGKGRKRKGDKDRVPRSTRASIMRIAEEIVQDDPELIRQAFLRGLNAKPPASMPYLKLCADHFDGLPKQPIEHSGPDGGPIVTIYVPQKDGGGSSHGA